MAQSVVDVLGSFGCSAEPVTGSLAIQPHINGLGHGKYGHFLHYQFYPHTDYFSDFSRRCFPRLNHPGFALLPVHHISPKIYLTKVISGVQKYYYLNRSEESLERFLGGNQVVVVFGHTLERSISCFQAAKL